MPDEFSYDVFLTHSAKDKAVVRPLAERLRVDGLKVRFDKWGLKPGDNIRARFEEGLGRSLMLMRSMSANAFGSDRVQLASRTFHVQGHHALRESLKQGASRSASHPPRKQRGASFASLSLLRA